MPSSPCVVLTREPEDNLPLARALLERGVPVCEIPCVATRYLVPDQAPSGAAAIAFASRRAVRGFVLAGLVERLLGVPARPLVAAVGAATRLELAAHGVVTDLVAEPATGRVLAGLLDGLLEPGGSVLIPCGNLAGGGLESQLRELGRRCQALPVYANEPAGLEPIAPFPVLAVFVAAPSAAERLLARAPWFRDHPFLAIGPTTAAALEECGVTRILGPAMSLEQQVEILTGLA